MTTQTLTRVPVPVLGTDGFLAYTVATRTGPHVTMQAASRVGGRLWTTTSKRSLKARSVQAHGHAAAMAEDGDVATILAGRTIALDPTDPTSAAADPAALFSLVPGVLGMAAANAEQLVGYVEARAIIPADWLPHRRLILVTRIDAELQVDGWNVGAVRGRWQPTVLEAPSTSEIHCLPSVADDVDAIVDTGVPVRLGVSTPTGPVPLPAALDDDHTISVSAAALATVGAQLPGDASLTFDDSTSRRPDHKLGVMFRGRATLVDVDGPRAVLTLATHKVTTWDGFRTSTGVYDR